MHHHRRPLQTLT